MCYPDPRSKSGAQVLYTEADEPVCSRLLKNKPDQTQTLSCTPCMHDVDLTLNIYISLFVKLGVSGHMQLFWEWCP